jgi:hypothetical protein
MAFLVLLTVFIGFAHTYYLAGIFQASLPNRLIHIHGAVFTCWIFLLITQTSLVSAGRVDIHRRLGLFGFALACSMPFLRFSQPSTKWSVTLGGRMSSRSLPFPLSTSWPSSR